MEQNVTKHLIKIDRLLKNLFYSPKKLNSVKFDKFLNLLSQQEDQGIESTLIVIPLLSEWLDNAVSMWSTTGLRPNPQIYSFLLGLTGFLAKNEQRFIQLSENSVFIKLIAVLEVQKLRGSNELKLGYIRMLTCFLGHEMGLSWMQNYDFWEDIYKFGTTIRNEGVFEASTRFLATFLRKMDGDEFCDRIIKEIVPPIGDMCNKEKDDVVVKKMRFVMKVLEFCLEDFLKDKEFKFGGAFLRLFSNLISFLDFDPLQIPDFHCRKGIYMLKFLELYDSLTKKSKSEVLTAVDKIRNNYILDLCGRKYEDVVEFTHFSILLFNLLEEKIAKSEPKHNVNSFQFVIVLVVPFYGIFQNFPRDPEMGEFDEYRNDLIDNMLRLMKRDLVRSSYKWRDNMAKRSDCFQIAFRATTILKETIKFFTKKEAVMVVRTILYFFKDFDRTYKLKPEKISLFYTHTKFFFNSFELLNLLLTEFSITWNDIYEILYLMPLALDFLSLPNCPLDLSLLILQSIATTIEKSDAPNLTLLFDNTQNLFAPLVHFNLFHELAVMRNATLQIVYTVGHVTRCKFPSLQKVLMDSELPTLVVKMSACDSESFVRATAIKCLQEMIQVEDIWNNALKSEDLPQKMRDILLNETEGIVRVEAATFMCVAYENQQFPKDTLDRVYETMIYSSTTDLHWEVKVRALSFWDKVIKNHLQNQGMIDDSFPNVTFSKEHRKIVTLTDSEIKKRLIKVLSQLSSIGCLGVLMSAIKDDCDMEVAKTAVKITQRLVDLFKKYKLTGDSSAPTSPNNGQSLASVSMSSGISVDESMDSPRNHDDFNEDVIEQIVNSKDVNLLKNVYAPSDYGSVSNYDIQVKKIVSPNEFLLFTQQDLNGIISEKKKWLNGIEDLGSLLDDMLKTYDDEVNNMDCY